MNAVERALRDFLGVRPIDVGVAVVGGIAVSVRTEPRFTRDIDFAVAVADDVAAEQYAFAFRQAGYELITALEQTSHSRLSTIRLRQRGRGPLVDLLFSTTGIEVEIVAAAEPLEVATGLVAHVARTGHLIAMKLLSCDDNSRPNDRSDLLQLAKVASDAEWSRAEQAVQLIEQRRFNRGRDLRSALAKLRRDANPDQ